LQACALWLGVAPGTASLFMLDAKLNPAIPHLIAVGFQLYILSIARHSVLLALQASRGR
jgi:hypothetical protein